MKKYRKTLIYGIVILLCIGLFYFALVKDAPELYHAIKSGSPEQIQSFLDRSGKVGGMICLCMLQFMQEVSLVMSAAVIQFAAGLEYGFFKGLLLCEIGYVSSNVIIFILARKFSGLTELIGESNGKKINKAIDFINQYDPMISIIMLCIIPIVPNGIVPYAASQMKIKLKDFTIAVILGCTYPMIVMLICGRRILDKDWLVIILVFISNLVLCGLIWGFRKQLSDLFGKLRRKGKNDKAEITGTEEAEENKSEISEKN